MLYVTEFFANIGKVANYPIYITTNLFQEGYKDKNKLQSFIKKGIGLLSKRDKEDTDYLHSRVIEKGKMWVCLTGEGIAFMKPEDY
jgi:hypothetical protein